MPEAINLVENNQAPERRHLTFQETERDEELEEEPLDPRHCCIGKILICSAVTFCIGFFVFCIILSVMGAIFSGLSNTRDVDYEGDPWPVKDEKGYYQSFKENGKWVNHWHKDMPSPFAIGAGFMFSEDESNIPSDSCFSGSGSGKCALDETLPVHKPYWLRDEATTNQSTDTKSSTVNKSDLRATWIGHATVLAEVDGATVLADPIFSDRCFPVQFMGPKRYRPPACTIEELPEVIDAVVISHTHYDHMDLNSIVSLHKKYGEKLHWFVPSGSKSWFSDRGISEDNIHDMVWWQSATIPTVGGQPQDNSSDNVTKVVFTPGNHFSRRGLFDGYKALWGSWAILGSKGHKFWFGGDTAYSDVFKQIGERYGPFDLSAIPIGAYNPRLTMKFVHVDPQEAVKIHYDLKSKLSFGIHWATFKLTLEHYMEPKEKILEIASENPGMQPFLVPDIGESVNAEKLFTKSNKNPN